MFDTLKPILYYDYCSRCRECCVFHDPDGVWTPRVTPGEVAELARSTGQGASMLSAPDRLRLVQGPELHQCLFLDREAYRCSVYASRPVECRLYPFLISSESEGVKLYAHLACPFVQERNGTREWQDYVVGLRAFFSRTDVRRYVADNRAVFPDYGLFKEQLLFVFDIRSSFPRELLLERERFEAAVGKHEHRLSAYAYPNLFVWQDAMDFYLKEIDGFTCVLAQQPVGTFAYLPPLGGVSSKETIGKVFEHLRALNRGGGMTRLENVSQDQLALFDQSRYCFSERGQEYIYLRRDIAGLHGTTLKSKRHDVNLVERKHAPSYRNYEPADREACLQLFHHWLDRKLNALDDDSDIIQRHMLEDALSVHSFLWDFWQPLGLEGRVAVVNGRVAAYTFGCPLSEETYCILVEVSDPDVAGLGAFIFRTFADDRAIRKYQYLNAMDDYGLPALTRSKLSWRPHMIEKVYTVTEKGAGVEIH